MHDRTISLSAIHMNEAARQRARDLWITPEFKYGQRQRKKVEALFAELKGHVGLRRLRLRRLKFVREQFFLAATAQNIKRLVRFLSQSTTPPLTATASWLIAFREHDAIAACFDEESQHMLESSAEPALCVVFSPDKPNEVERAIRAVDRFVSFNAELCLLAEELGKWEASNGCGDSDRGEPPLRSV
jgi:hypothetical protein